MSNRLLSLGRRALQIGFLALPLLAAAPLAAEEPPADEAAATEADSPNRITREGVVVDFSVTPVSDSSKVIAADWADVTFRITDASTGEPVKGRYPAAWMDLSEAWEARGAAPLSCRGRIETYLQGIVGVRPMINLNDHFLLVMNRDASISVIDPAVGITGITNLFAQINLDRPAADWVKTDDQKRLFVSMPEAKQVAHVDTDDFKVEQNVDAGEDPTRVELQGDERYLWVGNNAKEAEKSGVTVIDTEKLEPVAFIQTGRGHHEIAFSDGDRHAFVSNRDSGTVSVIDVQTLQKVKDVETGPLPISLAYSPLSKAIYAADGKAGTVTVIDPDTFEVVTRMEAKPGLGPMRFSKDGRWGVVVNPVEDVVHIIDAADNRVAHTVRVGSKPYQVSFTRQYAYIRSLGSEQVALISVPSMQEPGTPPVQYFVAGQGAPGRAADISIADAMIPSVKEAASYVVNQAEGTVYYYMEGMTAPMGAFRNYGHEARAIEIVDRSLHEDAPGVYSGRVKLPVEGTYDVAFMMDTPRFLHCFSARVEPNPAVKQTKAKLGLEFQLASRSIPVGQPAKVRFRLTDPSNGLPRGDIPDVSVLYYAAAGGGRNVVAAEPLGDGVYEAEIQLDLVTTYYLFVGAPSENVPHNELPFASVMGAPAPPAAAPTEAAK